VFPRREKIFLFGFAVTYLKAPIRTNKSKEIQGNSRLFAWFYLVLFGPNSPLGCVCRPKRARPRFELYDPRTINAMAIEPSRDGKRDFILANTRLIAPPLTPEIRLRLAHEAVPIWQKTEEELGAIGCRRRSGRSPGRAARRWRATRSTIRLLSPASARWISHPARGWSRSRLPRPARLRSRPPTSTPSPSPRSRRTPPRMAS